MSTKIEWVDETLNPLGWGCWGPGGTPDHPLPCSYCYARRLAKRHIRACELCRQFVPHWHQEQIDKALKWDKPRRIFWQSMGDLFHPCTPLEKIKAVLATVQLMPRHTHIFLTKNPGRYQEFNPWPKNCWLGTTVTNQPDADDLLPLLLQAEAQVRFASHEPLLGAINVEVVCDSLSRLGLRQPFSFSDPSGLGNGPNYPRNTLNGLHWGIIGAMTGPVAVKPKLSWVQNLIDQYLAAGVPIFLKDNLKWPEMIQEFPKEAT